MKIVAIQEVIPDYVPLPDFIDLVPFEEVTDADVWVQFNIGEFKQRKRYGDIFEFIQNSGKPWIVIESPLFRYNSKPGSYWRWSWHSYFRDTGMHCLEDHPSDRWQRIQQEHDIQIQPWTRRGERVLYLMQRPGDTSNAPLIKGYGNYSMFVRNTLHTLLADTDRDIDIRLHPLRVDQQMEILKPLLDNSQIYISDHSNKDGASPNCVNGGESLYRDLDNAWCAVGANSNSLIETVCYGTPTVCLHPSAMAWPMCIHDTLDIERPMQRPDRTQWLSNLAYCQWTTEEVLDGTAWRHLKMLWDQQHSIDTV